jgi:hypothetical protein
LRPHHRTALALAIAAVALAACSAEPEANIITVTSDQVAEAVARRLEMDTGRLFEVDCGDDEEITILSGTEVACTVVDPATGVEADATASLESIGQGAGWRARVEIAEEPGTASPSSPEAGTD